MHPICIATKSNDNPNKWVDTQIEVLGFATEDHTFSKAADLKSAKLNVFDQMTCNKKLMKILHKQLILKRNNKSGMEKIIICVQSLYHLNACPLILLSSCGVLILNVSCFIFRIAVFLTFLIVRMWLVFRVY